jgi:hypothetical protein
MAWKVVGRVPHSSGNGHIGGLSVSGTHATPEPASLAQALRTVAAALERLADVIAAERNASGPQARHARHRP